MELSRLTRMLRARWAVVVIGVMLGAVVSMLLTDWYNRQIQPVYQATAAITHLAQTSRSGGSQLQSLLSLALLANADLLAGEDRVSITSDDQTNQILFTATAPTPAEASETAEQMRRAFNEADPANEEPLIRERLAEIVDELGNIEEQTVTTDPQPVPGFEDDILVAQIDALRQRLGELADELALVPISPETEEQRTQIETEMEDIGGRIAVLETELAALGGTVELGTEEELQQSALEIYASELVSEYQTLFLRLLGRNPTTRDEGVTSTDLTPSRRSVNLMAGLGGIAGGLLAMAILVLADMARRPVWARTDVEPHVASLLELPPRRPGRSPAMPWYPQARPGARKRGVQALRSMMEGTLEGSASVGLVDLGAGTDQVTTLAADLGAALAASGRSILVIDANLTRNPRARELAGGDKRLADVLNHRGDDEEELRSFIKRAVGDQSEALPGMRVLPAGTLEGDRVDALAGRQLAMLLQEARTAFDTVLVATPPLTDPGALAVSQRLDYLLLVTRAGKSTVTRLKQAERDLRTLRSRLLGAVLLVGRPVRSRTARQPKPRRSRRNRSRSSARHLPSGSNSSPGHRRRPSPPGSATEQGRTSAPRSYHPVSRKAAKSIFAAADLLRRRVTGPRILIYHQVGTDLGREMEVSIKTFRRQLDWLQSHGEIVSLEDALLRVKEPGAARLYVLTFDDGYRDLYENAFPLLRERRLPFTLYLTTDPVESGTRLDPRAEPLNWDQVAEMLASGLMTLGSHTHHHRDLRDLDAATIAHDLDTSDILIRERLGVRVWHFAYPWGYWSETAEPVVKERFVTAVLGGGPPVTDATDPHRIHRVPIQRSDGMLFFRRKIKKGMRLEEAARRRTKGYQGPRQASQATPRTEA